MKARELLLGGCDGPDLFQDTQRAEARHQEGARDRLLAIGITTRWLLQTGRLCVLPSSTVANFTLLFSESNQGGQL